MKRWIAPALGLALAFSVGLARPAAAFRLKGAKPAANSAMHAVGSTVTGIVKGAPAGKVYTVVSGKRVAKVDASHARVRMKGKFASASALAPGAFVRVQGSMNGDTLNAATVDVLRPAGGSRTISGNGPGMGHGKKMGKKQK